MFSKKNLRKATIASRRIRWWWTGAACNAAILGILLHARAEDAEIARIEAQQPQQHRAKTNPRPTPSPLPALPSGLVIGNRSIDRQDDPTPPAASQLSAFNLTALVSHGAQGRVSENKSPLWVESDQSTHVVLCDGSGVLALDTQAAADMISVRVHDQHGNVVTFSERAYRTPYAGAVESPLCAVRLDAGGNLLPMAVVRLTQAEDGSVTATRDSDFGQPLIVHYRLHRAGDNPRSYLYSHNLIIPAGEASAPLQVAGKAGDVLTLAAGFSYTPAPLENSDVIEF